MKRRDFLKATTAASAPLLINGVPLMAAPSTGNSFFDFLANSNMACGKVLVIIQQNGGNDGLNTVIPLDRYDQLAQAGARGNVIYPNTTTGTNPIIQLNTNTALHGAMVEMGNLFYTGKLCVVQGVSYNNPSYSHFRATDIWFSGAASNEYLDTGWLGRQLDVTYPNYPQDYSDPLTSPMKDPLAVQIGSTLPFSLQGPSVNMGYNVTDPAALLDVINATTDPAPNNDYGRELSFLRLMKSQSNIYKDRITATYNAQLTQSTQYPASGNSLANQLKIVARLIGGGLKTPIYIVNHPNSHDTHENQVADPLVRIAGSQFNNLSILSKAIGAFQNDIDLMGKGDKVTGMTFSEFGRRVKSNDSNGTDHGTAAPVFFFGSAVHGGVFGQSLTLPSSITVNTQINMQHDYRQLYATVMQDWLCLTHRESNAVLGISPLANGTDPLIHPKLGIFTGNTTPLPLEGVSLTGQYYQGQSRLTCKAEQNQKYKWYALQFSTDGARFTEVRRITNTSSNTKENYLYTHTTSAPKMFYRIAAEDHQGKIDYSNTIMLRSSDKQQVIRVFPNPVVNNNIHVEFLEPVSGPVTVTIYDLIGAKHYYNHFNGVQTTLNFRVPPSFSRETHYILEVKYGDTVTREQIIFR